MPSPPLLPRVSSPMTHRLQLATEPASTLSTGPARAADDLLPLVYEKLRALAARYLSNERRDHTLQPTALVHEAYVRLTQLDRMDWRGKAHFFAMAARTLRRVLVDHARGHRADKRGAGIALQRLEGMAELECESATDVLELEVALERLTQVSPLQAKLVELRFFGGLSMRETSVVLEVGLDRVKSEWRFARAWLLRELRRDRDDR